MKTLQLKKSKYIIFERKGLLYGILHAITQTY